MLTYSFMASFQARAATKPKEEVRRVRVWIAIFLDTFSMGFLAMI